MAWLSRTATVSAQVGFTIETACDMIRKILISKESHSVTDHARRLMANGKVWVPAHGQ